MNQPALRRYMFKEKSFLKALTSPLGVRSLIKKASLVRVNLLIRVLYEVCTSKIPLSELAYKQLRKARKLDLLNNYLGCRATANKTLDATKASKVQFLLLFSKNYRNLLFRLFNNKK